MSNPPSHETFLAQRYFSSLDIFRCGSILAVIFHHTETGVPWLPISERGYLGVDFFFVISGFLIVTLLLRERDRTGHISLRRFYLRRTLRIFPIYYGMIAAITAFFVFIRPDSPMAPAYFQELPYQLFYLSNFVKITSILFFTWTLAAEEQFYLFWPPIEKWLQHLAIPILFVFIALNQCVNFGVIPIQVGAPILQITFTPICLGVLLAHLLHDRKGFNAVAALMGLPWVSVVMLVLVILAANWPYDLTGWPRLTIQLSIFLLMASCVIREDQWLSRLFGFPLIRRIGIISYGMYIYHMFAAHAADSVLGPAKAFPLVPFLVSTLFTIVVAELSFRYYEKPFLRLKDHLDQRLRRRES